MLGLSSPSSQLKRKRQGSRGESVSSPARRIVKHWEKVSEKCKICIHHNSGTSQKYYSKWKYILQVIRITNTLWSASITDYNKLSPFRDFHIHLFMPSHNQEREESLAPLPHHWGPEECDSHLPEPGLGWSAHAVREGTVFESSWLPLDSTSHSRDLCDAVKGVNERRHRLGPLAELSLRILISNHSIQYPPHRGHKSFQNHMGVCPRDMWVCETAISLSYPEGSWETYSNLMHSWIKASLLWVWFLSKNLYSNGLAQPLHSCFNFLLFIPRVCFAHLF